MRWLKQGTTVVMVGPFLKTSNGYTRSTGETLSTSKVKLSKNDAALANKASTKASSHSAHGHYRVFLTTVDSGTLGRLRMSAIATACLPVWEDFMVVNANVYNSVFAGSDYLTVDVLQNNGVASTLSKLTTAKLDAAVAGLSTHTSTQVATAILITPANKLRTDTQGKVILTTAARAEPGQGAPLVNADLAAKVDYLFKSWRNKKTQDGSTWSLYNDAGAVVDQKATISDDGTTATFGEIGSG